MVVDARPNPLSPLVPLLLPPLLLPPLPLPLLPLLPPLLLLLLPLLLLQLFARCSRCLDGRGDGAWTVRESGWCVDAIGRDGDGMG